jgi:hypothetical protein
MYRDELVMVVMWRGRLAPPTPVVPDGRGLLVELMHLCHATVPFSLSRLQALKLSSLLHFVVQNLIFSLPPPSCARWSSHLRSRIGS